MQRVNGYVQQGNVVVVTGGVSSTTVVEGSYPGSTVSVFQQGSAVLASIFSDNIGTIKANPFTSSSTDGSFFFYAANQRVDIQFSGTGITTPFTIGDVLISDSTVLPLTVAFSATPTFNVATNSWFIMTLTGNVTAPTFPNAQAGDVLYMTLIQDAVGGRTFAWPVAFLNPPAPNPTASLRSDFIFAFDGTNWRHFASGDSASFNQPVTMASSLAVTGNETVGGTLSVTGAATFSSTINKVTLTQPATGSTLTLADGKTLTANNSITLAGVDGKTLTDNNNLTLAGVDGTTLTFQGTDTYIGRNTTDTIINKTIGAGGLFGIGIHTQVFSASGTFTIPTGITQVEVEVVAAGGAGGGGTAASAAGSGGGSGGSAKKALSGLTPGNTLTVTVGTGGTGVSGGTGNAGGVSSVTSGTQVIVTITTNGGLGGGASASAPGGGGAQGTGGDENNGGNAGDIALTTNTLGGTSAGSIKGGGVVGGNGNNPGTAGAAPGAGGSGGGGTAGNTTGGAGANGEVIFKWIN